jgi:hypothetical protein
LNWRVWQRWVFANAWGELVGLGGSAAVAVFIFGGGDRLETPATILVSAAILVAIATVLEGGAVGLAQWTVLRRDMASLTWSRWVGATALGACVAWILGVVPSTLLSLRETAGDGGPPELSGAAMIGLAFLLGLILGPILAVFQWRVLRGQVRRAGWWIPANAVAWAFGMAVIFAGAGAIPEGAASTLVVGVVAITCIAAGAVVGAIHGIALVWLLHKPGSALQSASLAD